MEHITSLNTTKPFCTSEGSLRWLPGCMPRRATRDSAAYDLFATMYDDAGKIRRIRHRSPSNREYEVAPHVDPLYPDGVLTLAPHYRCLMPVGIWSVIPEGKEAQIRPRSGLAWRLGLAVLNAPGTIDPDFRDEWHVILENRSTEPVEIRHGDRIAQVVFQPIVRIEALEADEHIERTGGYGSTGR